MKTTELNPVPELPGWLVAPIVILLIAVCGVAMADDAPDAGLVPGGIQVQAEGGTVRFVIDLADVNWSDPRIKTLPWVFRPIGAMQVMGDNTLKNWKHHPGKWTVVGIATYALASGKASEWADKGADLLGIGDDKDSKRSPAQSPASGQDRPAVVVTGTGNSVTTTEADGIWVDGSGNSVTVNPYPMSDP